MSTQAKYDKLIEKLRMLLNEAGPQPVVDVRMDLVNSMGMLAIRTSVTVTHQLGIETHDAAGVRQLMNAWLNDPMHHQSQRQRVSMYVARVGKVRRKAVKLAAKFERKCLKAAFAKETEEHRENELAMESAVRGMR